MVFVRDDPVCSLFGEAKGKPKINRTRSRPLTVHLAVSERHLLACCHFDMARRESHFASPRLIEEIPRLRVGVDATHY